MSIAREIYDRVRSEACADVFTSDGSEWASVLLSKFRPEGISAHQFAGYLSALEAKGLYQPDGDAGLYGLFLIDGIAKSPTPAQEKEG